MSILFSMDSSRLDDEHKLIAMYAQRLSQEAKTVVSTQNIDLGFVSGLVALRPHNRWRCKPISTIKIHLVSTTYLVTLIHSTAPGIIQTVAERTSSEYRRL